MRESLEGVGVRTPYERTDELTNGDLPDEGEQEGSVGNAREPYYSDDSVQLFHGDCLDVLRSLPDNSVDSVVCDPPYGLANTTPEQIADTLIRWINGERDYLPTGQGFMGKAWDAFVPPVAVWDDCLRVLKPGGHLLAFAGSRTHDLMTLAIRMAGFDIRDSIAWLYGSGFPKSLDVSKAIDKAAGATREVVLNPRAAQQTASKGRGETVHVEGGDYGHVTHITPNPATPAAQQWQGWGTALKPAFEPVIVARKPLVGTVAANVLAHGTGALNVDGSRVAHRTVNGGNLADNPHLRSDLRSGPDRDIYGEYRGADTPSSPAGRWPTNVVLDDSQAAALDAEVGTLKSGANPTRRSSDKFRDAYGDFRGQEECTPARGADEGGPSRFFPTFKYAAKAPTRERPSYVREGADGSVAGSPATSGRRCNVCGNQTVPKGGKPWPACGHDDWTRFETENRTAGKVAHPTVKPLTLMQWLVRLVTPPGGVVLEPFAGSGTTVEACLLEGFRCIAIEREADYLPLIEARIARQRKPDVPTAAEALALFDFEEPA